MPRSRTASNRSRTGCRRRGVRSSSCGSKRDQRDVLQVAQLAQTLQSFARRCAVQVVHAERLAAALTRDSDLHAADVDAGVAEQRSDATRDARAIGVARQQQQVLGYRVDAELVE